MTERSCLILTQYRKDSTYNDFIGKYYHFPATRNKNYLKQFDALPIEFIYFEPQKGGEGVFFGYGRIAKPPFPDKREDAHYFAEIADYMEFSNPVSYKTPDGDILEEIRNPQHFNPRNAVRKISPEFLDELCLDGGIKLYFEADAHLVQVLGEQLIASERIGILELVKNGFDAGATVCNVRVENVPGLDEIPSNLYEFPGFDGPVIVVEDNGSGMTRSDIERGWLRPASRSKTDVKERIRKERRRAIEQGKLGVFDSLVDEIKAANRGRVPLGEKGVGRFATHRLGRKLVITTKTAESDFENLLGIDWDDFDSAQGTIKNLNQIPIILTRQKPSRDYGPTDSGTRLVISGGRTGYSLTEDEIREINRTLLNLNSPNPSPGQDDAQRRFFVSFKCPQLKYLPDESPYEKYDPVITVRGRVDENGLFQYDLRFAPPPVVPLPAFSKDDLSVDLRTVDKKNWIIPGSDPRSWRKPECGEFFIHLDVWIRDRPWLGSTKEDRDFKKYLENYGGISIYRDGINVFPAEWGAEADWLGLRQRQIKKSDNISYYHMIGNLEIDQSINVDLIDKTNREGPVRNQAFSDLTTLVRSIAYLVENEYKGKRQEYKALSGDTLRSPGMLQRYSGQSATILDNVSTSEYDIERDDFGFFRDIQALAVSSERRGRLVELSTSLKNLEKSLEQIRDVQDLLSEQAGFGLGIAVSLHEITKTTSNFYYGILELLKTKKFDEAKLEFLKETSLALDSEIQRLSPLRALRNEPEIPFKVSRSIDFVRSLFKRRFQDLGIEFDTSQNQDFEVIARFGALNQILTNLLDNACYWLDNPKLNNRSISIEINSKARSILVADNGPGIGESILPYLFQPGYSLKYPPSGLGLYICRHYMNMMKKRGDIYLTPEANRLARFSGAQFTLDFSKVEGSK